MMSEPMDMDDFPQNQPLPSEPETPHSNYEDPPVLRRRRAIDDQVEKVTDETGEMVRGAFLQFLETYSLKTSWTNIVLMMNLILSNNLLLNMLHLRQRVLGIFILRNSRRLNDSD